MKMPLQIGAAFCIGMVAQLVALAGAAGLAVAVGGGLVGEGDFYGNGAAVGGDDDAFAAAEFAFGGAGAGLIGAGGDVLDGELAILVGGGLKQRLGAWAALLVLIGILSLQVLGRLGGGSATLGIVFVPIAARGGLGDGDFDVGDGLAILVDDG